MKPPADSCPVDADALAAHIAQLTEQRDQLTGAIATKQAILLDLESRTLEQQKLKLAQLAGVREAAQRLADFQDQLGRLLSTLPALPQCVAASVSATLSEAITVQVDRAVRVSLRRHLARGSRPARFGKRASQTARTKVKATRRRSGG
jgi:hypothetical protein